MEKIAAGYFKAHCLAIMDDVRLRKKSVLITKRGKPVARLVPAGREDDDIYGFLRGHGAITGDVLAPAIDDWGNLG